MPETGPGADELWELSAADLLETMPWDTVNQRLSGVPETLLDWMDSGAYLRRAGHDEWTSAEYLDQMGFAPDVVMVKVLSEERDYDFADSQFVEDAAFVQGCLRSIATREDMSSVRLLFPTLGAASGICKITLGDHWVERP